MKFWRLFLCSFSLTSGTLSAAPPVLVISIDDLNDWVSCLGGHPQARTPNIDRLAKRGTLFTNAHCQAPVCTPSRASMMTGMLPSTTGLYFLRPGLEASEVAAKHPHLLETFSRAGYETLGAGKFVHRNEQDYFQVYGGGMGGFGPLPKEKITYPEGLKLWDWGAHPETDEETPDSKVADWVIGELEKTHEKPFFLVAGFWRPHVPMYAPKRWHDLFPIDEIQLPKTLLSDRDDLPPYALDLTDGLPAPRHEWFLENDEWKSAVQSYLASVAFVDHQVGRVLDALDASPHAEETIVVLFSDHGWHLGEKQHWAKRSLWTDGTRVPLIISAPGFPAGKECDQPAGLIDLYPTLMELTGISPPDHLEGRSLMPQLRDPGAVRESPAVCTFGPGNHSLHFADWHYIRYADGGEELYYRKDDPHEWRNLAGLSEHRALIDGFQKYLPKSDAECLEATDGKQAWEWSAWQTAEENAKKRTGNAVVQFEAESFSAQEKDETRKWYVISKSTQTEALPKPDPDPVHLEGASGGSYLEILPDTRATHGDKLIRGENFSPEPGKMAILKYRVSFPKAGKYYVWARVFSTGTEDNGFHIGLNGDWPESGQRWQTVIKKRWHWECKQRTREVHSGVPMQLFLEIPSAGEHEVQISMREDGFELDQIILAMDRDYRPPGFARSEKN